MRNHVVTFFVLLVAAHLIVFQPTNAWSEVIQDQRSLTEANRLLEEEIKLVGHPQVYVLVDLADAVILIKGRGIELSRLPIASWRLSRPGTLTGVFRLHARPLVARPKAVLPAEDTTPVIEVDDMPQYYDLLFHPPLTISVVPGPGQPWLWAQHLIREWWWRFKLTVGRSFFDSPPGAHLHLTLPQDAAQAFAWSLTDGMAVLIRRPTGP
jgi:hypothetical protein